MLNLCEFLKRMFKGKEMKMKYGSPLPIVVELIKQTGVSTISLGDLLFLAGIENYFDGESSSNIKEAQMVAMLAFAADAKEENLHLIRQKLGDGMATNVHRLTMPYNKEWESRISVLMNGIKEEDQIIRMAAAALLNAEFHHYFHGEKSGNHRRTELLHEIISQNDSLVATKLKMIWNAMNRANSEEYPTADTNKDNTEPPWLISISIDLGGSTDAKTNLIKVVGSDTDRLQDLYAQLYRQFMIIEHQFYSDIFRKGDRDPDPLDFSKLFLIKGVGDELWMVYPIPRNSVAYLNHAMSRILPAALRVAYSSVEFLATEKRGNQNFDPRHEDEDLGQQALVNCPVKVFIDLIKDAYEIAEPRGEFFHSRVPEYYEPDNSAKFYRKIDVKHAEVASRLNLGFAEYGLRQYRIAKRSDYIGHEVDLFFRASKSAKPGLVTLGSSIYSKLNIEEEKFIEAASVHFTKMAMRFRLHPESSSAQRLERYWLLENLIPKCDLKGIGYDYKLFHLFRHFDLLGKYMDWDLSRDFHQNDDKDPYSETRKLIPLEGIEEVCKRERGQV